MPSGNYLKNSFGWVTTYLAAIDGFTANWLIDLHMNPETRCVYLVHVWDRSRAMHAICVGARTSEPMIYDCVELYAM